MAVLGPIIQAFVESMFKAGRDLASDRTIGAQLVRDRQFGQAEQLDQRFQKTFCCTLVAPGLSDFFQNDSLLINRVPELEFSPRDRRHNFILMPDIPRSPCRLRKFRAICGAMSPPNAGSFHRKRKSHVIGVFPRLRGGRG